MAPNSPQQFCDITLFQGQWLERAMPRDSTEQTLFCKLSPPLGWYLALVRHRLSLRAHFREKSPQSPHPPRQCPFDGTHVTLCVTWLPNQECAKPGANTPHHPPAAPSHPLEHPQISRALWQFPTGMFLCPEHDTQDPKAKRLLYLTEGRQPGRFPSM